MKKIVFLVTLLTTLITNAQVPQGISYQAIALNTSGNPVVSSNVRVKLSVLDNIATGTVLYSETHLKTTNPQGLFNLTIGQGTVVSGTFNTINWGTNSKFLKVEMDATGGTNYVAVGTTQLLSVPYALAADSLITSPGEGITLVSPNGTPYQLTVSDSGELSLPTTNNPSASSPNNFYMYGTFNTFNPTTALLMANYNDGTSLFRYGFRYLTAGTELKFLATNNASSPVYGVNLTNNLQVNGASFLVDTNGFYLIQLGNAYNPDYPLNQFGLGLDSLAPKLRNSLTSNYYNGTYSVATNKFTFNISISANNSLQYDFYYPDPKGELHGDNLADGSVESNGTPITISNTTGTPKNYRIELTINFNGSATYTVTQL
ncbi:hypothetical protein [Flavobacterium dankookense]|uniref:Carboxypeptidase family protein n=1 Tax=Flavobacterium dankookense TaxID=706186 RepID=A0A4R6QBT5_9FLAO|nr:hypothetical protein [Flavobacterium dankookense]TDP59303.1 hypothetical protein BC748_1550 [Flavobacterium dankookense]